MPAETHRCTDTSFKGGRFEAMGRVNLETQSVSVPSIFCASDSTCRTLGF